MTTLPVSPFFRMDTDQQPRPVDLVDLFAGPQPSACWLVGGGPSLLELPCEAIAASPIPRMCVNLAGAGCLRPTFWTSYDPTVRFHRSVYLDPGVLKFVHRRRAMDLVPETTFKVCDCPATFFFDREPGRGFGNVLTPGAAGIVDWADSMVQAIDVLYRLGFRVIYLAGCELRIRPSPALIERAAADGVVRDKWDSLSELVRACTEAGIPRTELETLAPSQVYHFDEVKPLTAAIQTDAHYFRIAQSLRLSRRCLSQWGLQLISVTPGSRLNQDFAYQPVDDVLAHLQQTVGHPGREPTRGLYTQQAERWSQPLEPMRDVKPPNWPGPGTALPVKEPAPGEPELLVDGEGWIGAGKPFRAAYVPPQEEG